jgi:hypothetical protein
MTESSASARIAWLRLGGVVVAVALCFAARATIDRHMYWGPAGAALAVGACVAAVLLGRPRSDMPEVKVVEAGPPSLAVRVFGVAVALLGFGAFGYGIYLLSADWNRHFTAGAPLVLGGVTFWSLGLLVWEGRRFGLPGAVPMPRWELCLFLGIVALGFFLRFYRYDYFPPAGVPAVEEPQSGLVAYGIIHEGSRPWEFVFDRWLPVPSFLLLGENITALRLPFTLVSALTLIPLYLLMRQLVSRPAALFALALFATSRWHLMYARFAHALFPVTLFFVIVFYLCLRVHRQGGLALYPWLGFLTGFMLYAYAGYRPAILFVAIFFAISLFGRLRTWRNAIGPDARSAARRVLAVQATGLAMAAIASAAPAVPLVFILRNDPGYYVEAARRATNNKEYYTSDPQAFVRQRVNRLREAAMMFHHYGDESATFNYPGAPMLDPITGVLFTIGLAYCLVWAGNRFQGFFAFTFLTFFVFGTVFVQNLDIHRLQMIVPLIIVLIAFVADRVIQVGSDGFGIRARPVLIGVGLVAGLLAFRDNYNVYFRGMMNDPRVRAAFQNSQTVALKYLHSLPKNAYLLFVTDTLNFFMPSDYIWWRGNDIPGAVTSDLIALLSGTPGAWAGHDLRVLIQDPFERDELSRLLQDRYPGTQCEPLLYPDLPPYLKFTACRVPWVAADAAFTGGMHARYYRDGDTTPLVERDEPIIGFAFLPDACRYPLAVDKPPCRAEWAGTWNVDTPGTYDFDVSARQGEIHATIDGNPLAGSVQLEAGPHELRVQAQLRSIEDTGVRIRWRPTLSGEWHLVHFARIRSAVPESH